MGTAGTVEIGPDSGSTLQGEVNISARPSVMVHEDIHVGAVLIQLDPHPVGNALALGAAVEDGDVDVVTTAGCVQLDGLSDSTFHVGRGAHKRRVGAGRT